MRIGRFDEECLALPMASRGGWDVDLQTARCNLASHDDGGKVGINKKVRTVRTIVRDAGLKE